MALSTRSICTAAALLFAFSASVRAEDWPSTLGSYAPGPFPPPRPLQVRYAFGWNGIIAANADLHFTKSDGRFQLEGTGQTIALARTLWKFDGRHSATTDERTLHPIHVHEVETVRAKTWETDLAYTPEGVTSQREQTQGGPPEGQDAQLRVPAPDES